VRNLIRRNGRIPESIALNIVLQCAQGLAYAHEKSVIHRDIKPDNLLLFSELPDEDPDLNDLFASPHTRVVIVDFGLAKGASETAHLVDMTQAATVLGSPSYMSPEQAMGKPVDFRSDIYSLGATFYHLVTGLTPFEAETPMAVIKRKLTEDFPDMRKHGMDLSSGARRLHQKMTASEAKDRYQDYRLLLDDLKSLVQSSERKHAPSLGRKSGRRRWMIGLGATALLVFIWIVTNPWWGKYSSSESARYSESLDHWRRPAPGWSVGPPDDETRDEVALIGLGGSSPLEIAEHLTAKQRVTLHCRLPGDGLAAVVIASDQSEKVRFEWRRTGGKEDFQWRSEMGDADLPPIRSRASWEWMAIDLQVFGDHAVLYVDELLTAQASWTTPLEKFKLLLEVGTGSLTMFRDLEVAALTK